MNALDNVSVHLQLGDDGGGEGNPGGVQFSKSDWLVAGLAQSIQQPLLLGVKETHRPDCRPPALLLPHRRGGAVSLARFGVLVESSRLAQCERRSGR